MGTSFGGVGVDGGLKVLNEQNFKNHEFLRLLQKNCTRYSTLQVKVFSKGLRISHQLVMPLTKLEIRVDSELNVSDVFTNKHAKGHFKLKNCMPRNN